MMYYTELLIMLLSITCILFLIIGLIKPWAMLWWEDVQTRMKVIQVYGSLAVVFGIVYMLMKSFL